MLTPLIAISSKLTLQYSIEEAFLTNVNYILTGLHFLGRNTVEENTEKLGRSLRKSDIL